MVYKPQSVLIVPFPFSDINSSKQRPVLVISNEAYQEKTGHIMVMMVTTAKQTTWPFDYSIQALDEAQLPVPCVIRQRIVSIDERLVRSTLGRLSDTDWQSLSNILTHTLAIRP
jgi:mRNA interferase MazF